MNEATRRQQDAAHPDHSTWLAANAGSGKTRVLTDRVARLLFEGVLPQNILCLTYTKAAASEMQNRLFARLGKWAMLDDEALRQSLRELGLSRVLNPNDLAQARTLFARAIETPGGLKIQTIHAFCAALLRRFPLEAGVSPQFSEIDDRAAELLREEIVDRMAQGPEAALLKSVARLFTGAEINELTKEVVSKAHAFEQENDLAGYLNLMGYDPALDGDKILRDLDANSVAPWLSELRTALAGNPGSYNNKVLSKLDNLGDVSRASIDELSILMLTQKGTLSSQFCTKSVREAAPDAFGAFAELADRVIIARDRQLALRTAERSVVLNAFGRVFLSHYAAEKQKRGWLDFDDLIRRAQALLADSDMAGWVLYRIDGGIDHILVDEAQDTSPAQWDVIWKLAEEFASGASARSDIRRTIFVVGDQKQSIYSFQGADPREFERMQSEFDNRLQGAGDRLHTTSLDHSFRSSPAILRLVDSVFAGRGGAGFPQETKHIAFHDDLPGRVDIWDHIPNRSDSDDGAWFDPVDRNSELHHNRILAKQVACEIRRMLADKVQIPINGKQARPVEPRDFLILVRRRSGIFPEIIRACKEENVPIAGSDVLRVGAELAVRDLGALLSFLATPEDDLSLATVLRSPLGGWSEDQLFRLAHGRGRQHLWQVLRSQEVPVVSMLNDLRGKIDFLRPYELLERILTRHDGRKKILGRLGTEAEDGIDALLGQALAYERNDIPSLTGFLAWMETDDLEVKRQIDSASNQIRVMTVHGAKGLEAPIVILPETAQWQRRETSRIMTKDGAALWPMSSKERPDPLKARSAEMIQAQEEENLRLLYVALTRAEKWLIVAAAGKLDTSGNDWFQMITKGAEMSGAAPVETPQGPVLRVQHGTWDKLELVIRDEAPDIKTDLPAHFRAPVEPVTEPGSSISPSDLGGAKALPGESLDEESAKSYGTFVHQLLERLPQLPETQQPDMFDNLVAETPLSDDLCQRALKSVKAVLTNPALAYVFAPNALAEVPVTAGFGDKRLHGVIDRLIVEKDRVRVIDFKSNRVVPGAPDRVPDGILRQLGAYAFALAQIYPDRAIETSILWTETGQIMELPHDIVTNAVMRSQHLDALATPT